MAKTYPISRSRGDEETPAGSPRGDAPVRPDVPVSPGGIVAGKYRIDAVIGFGGMGIVCEGFHLDLETKVEVQIARREHVNDERAVARFLSEARSAAQLRSQHTRRVIDCGRLDVGAPYLVVEHLDGVDLRSVGTAHGPLPVEEVMSVALQACEALGEAHSRGLVHGDLTPEDLFLTHGPDGGALVKVLGLGVRKQLGDRASPYLSPEQRTDPSAVDARTDVWSLGVLLHELLTGELPCEGSAATPSAIPESLAAIVARSMDRNRDARFPDAAALGSALRAVGAVTSPVTGERVEEVLRQARSDVPESVADAPERESVADVPASVADVPESVAAPMFPRSIPALPVVPPPPMPSAAAQPEPVTPRSVPALPRSEPVTSPSISAVAARSVPPALPSVPAARPSRGTGPPPLPPSHSPPAPALRRLVGTRGVQFALVGVLLGALGSLFASLGADPAVEPSSAAEVSAGATKVAPVPPLVPPAEPAVLPAAEPVALPAPPPPASALARTTASERARPAAPPKKPAPSTTPAPSPARKRAWSPYPELKSPELPPNVR